MCVCVWAETAERQKPTHEHTTPRHYLSPTSPPGPSYLDCVGSIDPARERKKNLQARSRPPWSVALARDGSIRSVSSGLWWWRSLVMELEGDYCTSSLGSPGAFLAGNGWKPKTVLRKSQHAVPTPPKHVRPPGGVAGRQKRTTFRDIPTPPLTPSVRGWWSLPLRVPAAAAANWKQTGLAHFYCAGSIMIRRTDPTTTTTTKTTGGKEDNIHSRKQQGCVQVA